MRKLVYAALASATLATASMANAAVTVTSTGTLNNPAPVAVLNPTTGSVSIDFGTNPITTSPYSTSFMFNTDGSAYSGNITASTSTSGATFTNAMLSGPGLSTAAGTFSGIGSNFVSLFGAPLMSGSTYTVTVGLRGATAFTGNATLNAVPEPATWAMMLLGFGAIGFAVRRRRNPVLAQIA